MFVNLLEVNLNFYLMLSHYLSSLQDMM